MSETKKTKKDIVFVYTAYSLRYVYLLLLIPYFSRILGPEGYGVVLAAMSLMQIIWLFTNWGFGIDGMREISVLKPDQYGKLFTKHLSGRLILSLVSIVVGACAVYYSAVLSEHVYAGALAILLGIISAYNLGWYFNGTGRPRKAVKLEILGFALNLALILLLVREPDDANIAIASILISGLIATALAHWWIKDEVDQFQLAIKTGYAYIKQTSPVFVYASSAMLLGAASTYLLSALSTAEQVGYFGSAERLVGAGLSFMAPMGAVFIPKVTHLFENNTRHAFQLVKKTLFALCAIGLTGLLVTIFFGDLIVKIIFGDAFGPSIEILKVMAWIFPIYACTLVFSTYIFIPLKHEKLLAKITIFGGMVNILIAVPLAMQYEGLGMAYARVISEMIIFICLMVSSYRLNIIRSLIGVKG